MQAYYLLQLLLKPNKMNYAYIEEKKNKTFIIKSFYNFEAQIIMYYFSSKIGHLF